MEVCRSGFFGEDDPSEAPPFYTALALLLIAVLVTSAVILTPLVLLARVFLSTAGPRPQPSHRCRGNGEGRGRRAAVAAARADAMPRMHDALTELDYILADQIVAIANAAVDDRADTEMESIWID
jgi:hypothetical protein